MTPEIGSRFDPGEIYDDPVNLGEGSNEGLGAITVKTEGFIRGENDLITELNIGEAGRRSKILQETGHFVSGAWTGAREVTLYVGKYPWQVAGAAGIGVVIGGTILYQGFIKPRMQRNKPEDK